jgi:hypothetical protein
MCVASSAADVAAADQKIADAIFNEQERRTSVSVWIERYIGFGSGVVASVIAAFIYRWPMSR